MTTDQSLLDAARALLAEHDCDADRCRLNVAIESIRAAAAREEELRKMVNRLAIDCSADPQRAELERQRAEVQRLTDLRVRDAAYSAEREREARVVIFAATTGTDWRNERWLSAAEAWLAGKTEEKAR